MFAALAIVCDEFFVPALEVSECLLSESVCECVFFVCV